MMFFVTRKHWIKLAMKQLTLILTAFVLSACTQPFIGIPGGKLSGNETEAPPQWQSLPDVVQIEVRPDDPYSLNIWAVNANDHIYVATRDAKWVPFIEADKRGRLKVANEIYAVTASPVTNADEMAGVAAAYKDKYDSEAAGDNDIVVFRLTAR